MEIPGRKLGAHAGGEHMPYNKNTIAITPDLRSESAKEPGLAPLRRRNRPRLAQNF